MGGQQVNEIQSPISEGQSPISEAHRTVHAPKQIQPQVPTGIFFY